MKILKIGLKLMTISLILWLQSSFALWIDHFNVTLDPEKAKIWEAFDVTIEAMDKNWSIVSDYNWTILVFSESDPEAEFPTVLKDNSYTFTENDSWKVKFENAVSFKNPWTQDLHVYDINDDTILWYTEVEITKEEVITNEEINIVSPEDWITLGDNTIRVSWSTKKNHQVSIVLNSEVQTKTNSNSDWLFEQDIEWLKDWENTIIAMVLDADNNIIWKSREISVKIDANKPKVKNVKIDPNEDVDPESEISAEVISDKWLKNVSLMIDDSLVNLEEVWDWIYRWKFNAPKEKWIYKIDVILQDYLWHETKELWSSSLSVKELEAWPEPTPDNNNNSNNDDDWNPPEIIKTDNTTAWRDPLKITWLKLTELKTKSILTWDSIKWVNLYNIYIKNEDWDFELFDKTDVPRLEVEIIWDEIKYDHFAVRAEWYDEFWKKYQWDLSEATKIQTWPEIYILIFGSLLLWWLIFAYRRKKVNS